MASKRERVEKSRKKWDRDAMKEAINAIREKKMGFLKASKYYNVPKTTLRRLAADKEKSLDVLTSTKLGRKPVLPPELEKFLVHCASIMEAQFSELTRSDIRSLAFQLAMKSNLPNPFSTIHQTAGKDWLRLFLKRHPYLPIHQKTGMSISPVKLFNKESVEHFLELLGKEIENHRVKSNINDIKVSKGLGFEIKKCPDISN